MAQTIYIEAWVMRKLAEIQNTSDKLSHVQNTAFNWFLTKLIKLV